MHEKESRIYVLAEGREVIERRIRTEPERFTAVGGVRLRARIGWMCRMTEAPSRRLLRW